MTAPRTVVALPDGEVVDVSEFLAGVAALTAGVDQPVPSTGITAVVAEMVHDCEDWARGGAQETTLERYFRTRSPDLRLLARIDALGAHDRLAPVGPVADPAALVAEVYANIATRDRYRVRGIRRLLARYGFTATLTPGWGVDLLSQREPVAALTERVTRLAAARTSWVGSGPMLAGLSADAIVLRAISAEATDMYLEWLEFLTLRYRDALAGESGVDSGRQVASH